MPKYLPFFLFLFSYATLAAQAGTTTEAEVQLQEIFIDGNREKLLGNWDKAAAKFQEVLQKDKTNDAAAYELARVYEAKKDLDNAISFAQKAVEWNPANPWYQIYLANLFQLTNKDKDAAAVYEQLIKNAPRNEEYYFKWAYYLVRAGEPAKAIKVYDDLEKVLGLNPEVSRHKHTLYAGMGDYKKATKELETLIAAFPGKPGYRHQLALFYEQINEKEKAREIYKQILAIAPDDARAKIALAEESKGNDDVLFLNSLKPVFENPNTAIDVKIKEILPYVNKLAENAGKPETDKNLNNTLIALASILETVHPGSAKAYSVLGDIFYYSGQKEKALEKYKKCLDLDDTVWLVWEQVLYLYAEKQSYDQLVKASDEALDIFPNQAPAYYLNGVGYNGTGKYQDAVNSLQQAVLMAGKNFRLKYDIYNELGKAWFYLKKYPQSNAAFEEAMTINSNDAAVLRNYSYYLAASGENLDKAKELATRLIGVAPGIPAHEDTYAFVLYKMKDYKGAKDWFNKALQHGGDNDPSILEHYGDALFQLGNASEAVQYWQKALEKGGKSVFLEKKAAEGKLYE